MDELDAYRCAVLILHRPDPDGHARERLDALSRDPAGLAAWRRIAAAMDVLRAASPAPGQPAH